jgi:hypothetical protein
MAISLHQPHVLELGRRVELVSMDKWCSNITIGLYRRLGRRLVVHSYSDRPDAARRLRWIVEAMATMAGLSANPIDHEVWFSCGGWHELGIRRALLEACKVDPAEPVSARPLAVDDPRSDQRIAVRSFGGGEYRVVSDTATPEQSRAPAVAAGLAKLLELETDDVDPARVRFACGAGHDRLISLLLMRAINVRATLRELEEATTRGILAAPSAQEDAR